MKHNYYFFKKQFILLVCITIFSCKEAENLKEATSFKNALPEGEEEIIQAKIERDRLQAEYERLLAKIERTEEEKDELQAERDRLQAEYERLLAKKFLAEIEEENRIQKEKEERLLAEAQRPQDLFY